MLLYFIILYRVQYSNLVLRSHLQYPYIDDVQYYIYELFFYGILLVVYNTVQVVP